MVEGLLVFAAGTLLALALAIALPAVASRVNRR
jgi:hypothetical protein